MPLSSEDRALRGVPEKQKEGLDTALIYGKYVVEHAADKGFFTLYDNKGTAVFESYNYATIDAAKADVNRFRKAILKGSSTIEEGKDGFFWKLKIGPREFDGPVVDSRTEAAQALLHVKEFALTDIVREQ